MKTNATAASVAGEVRAAMARRRISQTALAEALGMSQAAISRRLTGTIPFDVAELSAIATILGVPLSALLADGTVTNSVAS
jgi:transcriptional regulator with XRE-family HTH domain